MKRIVPIFCLFVFVVSMGMAQETEGYQFTPVYDLQATPVKDQHRSGTCWSFSGLSFLESEMLRLGKQPVDLSEMFIVRHCYDEKAARYVRMHGSLNFGGGGAFHDVLFVLKQFGAVPEQAYGGLQYGEEKHVHGEVDGVLKAYVDAVIKNGNRKLSTGWEDGYEGILDAYFGDLPKEFEYNGGTYTPQSFASEVVGINPDDYVQITSFTHHPFYSTFIMEVPDNWLWGSVYNVPLDDLMQIMEYSLSEGYTIGWATDVSEKGFSHRNGVAIVPETDMAELSDTERSRWETMPAEERDKMFYSFDKPVKEKVITPELRQLAFDNYQTTDDHGMHITGMVKDQNGTLFYKVKNSWNTDSKYKGYLYASEAFVKYKTISLMVHKAAIPKALRKKLNL